MTIRFDGKVAIVTGAGGGLGRAHALDFAKRGAKVVVNDLGGAVDGTGGNSARRPRSVVAEIKAAGGTAIANGASVTDDAGVAHLVKQTMDTFGPRRHPDRQCRHPARQELRQDGAQGFRRRHGTCIVMGTVKPAKALWQIMRDQQYGRIVVTTSSTGLYGNFGQTNYGAAKLALVGFMNTLKLEGAQGQHQGQRHLPGRRHAHDRKPHAAERARDAEAGICDAGRRLSSPAKTRRPA